MPYERRTYARLSLEVCEDRTLPSTCTVINLRDAGTGAGLEGDLRYCLDLANNNSESSNRIQFAPGLAGTITLTQGELGVAKDLEIDGPGADKITISGGFKSGVFVVPDAVGSVGVSIDDLTITKGIGTDLGFARMGGGLYNGFGNVTLTRVTFTGNVVNDGNSGAIINRFGSMTLSSCIVSNNAVRDGYTGGIRNEQWGTMTLIDSVVSGNRAEYWAGISTNGHMTIVRSQISGNISESFGGGLDVGGIITVVDSTISGNVAPQGGAGVYNVRGLLTIQDSTITDNEGTAFHTSGWTEIVDSTIANNHGNEAGGFYVYGGTLRVTNSTISGNVSDKRGGAINMVEFVNPPDPPDVVADLTACTITGNVAKGTGGGGIEVIATPDGSARLIMRSVIVAGNRSNGLGDDVHGVVISIGYNFIGDGDGSSGWITKDNVGTSTAPLDPQLAPLGDYGGKTWTHALPAGSPAIKKGDPALQGSYDQRGTWRQPFFNPDPGAFQTSEALNLKLVAPAHVQTGQPFVLTLTAVDANGNHATIYKGTVEFTSTDPAAQLPSDYTFASSDLGTREFQITLNTAGEQEITATELDGFPTGAVTITVIDEGGRASALESISGLLRRPGRRSRG